MSITLHIYTPEKLFGKYTADKVIVPVREGNLTIIHKRAPRSGLLTEGKVVLLNENNKPFKQWHIIGGIMEIASDICKIAVQNIEQEQDEHTSDF